MYPQNSTFSSLIALFLSNCVLFNRKYHFYKRHTYKVNNYINVDNKRQNINAKTGDQYSLRFIFLPFQRIGCLSWALIAAIE